MKKVGAFEAKTHFSALLLDAERGETIIVTKRGRPVAQLGPIEQHTDRPTAAEAMKALLRGTHRLGTLKMRDLIEEGRRR